MRFKKFLIFDKYLNPLKKMSPQQIKKELKSNWDKFEKTISNIPELEKIILDKINKNTNSNFKNLKDISKQKIKESSDLNEDFKHFWDWFKEQGWGAISIFPTLSLWFEFDKLFDNFSIDVLNFKKIAFYGLIWIAMILGKHLSMWKGWKKENPTEYEKEGKPGPFTI